VNFMVPVVPVANGPSRVISSACASHCGHVVTSSYRAQIALAGTVVSMMWR